MPGARYTDWTHRHVNGDPGQAAEYDAEARKLLGFVVEQARRAGLGTYKLSRRLADGAIITAEIHGSIPRITITPPPSPSGRRRQPMPDNFVCVPRNAANPNGVDLDAPEIMLRRQNKEPWRTLFYTRTIPQFAAVAPPRGTYRSENGIVAFPDGVRYAGNIDWRAENGIRVSWFGPSSRYWYDGWRQPSAQYGRHVFMLGQILLDVDAYCTESAVDLPNRLVLGAALDFTALRLYVVQASMDDRPTTPPDESTTFDLTPPSPTGSIPVSLYRYSLIDTGLGGAMTLQVVAGSAELLWSGSLAEGCNPWFFNQSITRAVSYSVPAYVGVYVSADDAPIAAITEYAPVSAQSYRYELTIGAGATLSTTTTSLPAGTGAAPIASDFVDDIEKQVLMRRMNILGDPLALALQIDTDVLPLYYHQNIGGLRPDSYYSASVFWVDARERAVAATASFSVLRDWESTPWTAEGREERVYELFIAGGKIVGDALITNGAVAGLWQHRPRFGIYGGAAYPSAPAAWLYFVQSGDYVYTSLATGFFGFLGQSKAFPYTPSDELFGGASGQYMVGDPQFQFSTELGLDSPPPEDALGRRWLIGAAASNGDALYALRMDLFLNNNPETPEPFVKTFLSDSDLAARTGIAGASATYQPVWLLGALPRAMQPTP